MKFGGTSMGSAERIRSAAALCEDAWRQRPVVVVVSAMAKVTDMLLEALRHAEGGDEPGLGRVLAQLDEKHRQCCAELLEGPAREETQRTLDAILEEFARIARGVLMLGERPPRSVDEAIAAGERLSAALIASYARSRGIDAFAVNGWDVIVTDAVFGNASPLLPQTREKASALLRAIDEAESWG